MANKKHTERTPGAEEHKQAAHLRPEKFVVDLRIYGVPADTKEKLENIASHIGIGLGPLLKPHLLNIIKTYPEHMQNTRKAK